MAHFAYGSLGPPTLTIGMRVCAYTHARIRWVRAAGPLPPAPARRLLTGMCALEASVCEPAHACGPTGAMEIVSFDVQILSKRDKSLFLRTKTSGESTCGASRAERGPYPCARRAYSRRPVCTAVSKHNKSGKPLVYIPFEMTLALGALAANTLVLGDLLGAAFTDRAFRVLYVKAAWNMRTITVGDGPIKVGFAHGDYSVAEVDEHLEVDFVSEGGKIEAERRDRLVRRVGGFPGLDIDEVLNDGKEIFTRLNWKLPEGHNLAAWAKNRSESTFTTGQTLVLDGTIVGRWI